jgi:putative membrane protein
MKYIIIRTLAILVTSYFTHIGVPLAITFHTLWLALLIALILAVVNHTIKPIFMLVSIPINVITLGLFSFVINGLMILLAHFIVPEFSVPSLLLAIYFSIVLSIVNWVLHIFE